MPTIYRDARAFFEALRDMAEELRKALVGCADGRRRELVGRAVVESDLVYGVWPEAGERGGFGVQIIKGEDLMPPLIGFETDQEFVVAAIPCASLEPAIAARDAWSGISEEIGAGEGIRTLDPNLGKVVLYP